MSKSYSGKRDLEDNEAAKPRGRKSGYKRKRTLALVGMGFVLIAVLLVAFLLGMFPFEKSQAGPKDYSALQVDKKETQDTLEPEDTEPGELFPLEQALKAKGVYVSIDCAGTPSRFATVIRFVRKHEDLNALVIDVKDNSGKVPCDVPRDIPCRSAGYTHFPGLIKVLKREGYYLIARVVAFQDPYMATICPEQAIRKADGSLWRDRDGRLWLNPYDKRNWEFIRDIALWAEEIGFDEIQLDYVRFPDGARDLEKMNVLLPGSEKFNNRSEAIVAFLQYLAEALEGKAYLSADVFGFVTIATDDMGIGQQLEQIASVVDFVCPMVYPSHYYNPGIYGFQVPEAHPYEVVFKAMDEALERTKGLKAKIRPWLQDFSMKIHYGPDEVQRQINAVLEHDIDTFLLWNPANAYTEGVTYSKNSDVVQERTP